MRRSNPCLPAGLPTNSPTSGENILNAPPKILLFKVPLLCNAIPIPSVVISPAKYPANPDKALSTLSPLLISLIVIPAAIKSGIKALSLEKRFPLNLFKFLGVLVFGVVGILPAVDKAPEVSAAARDDAILKTNCIGLNNKFVTATRVQNPARPVYDLIAKVNPPFIAKNIPPAAANFFIIPSPISFNPS